MGQPAFVNTGSIYFERAEDALLNAEFVAEWIKNANEGTLSNKELNGDYNIFDLAHEGYCWISFKADSNRLENLEWQMENFKDFIKTLDNAVAFEAPIMVESDNGIFWEAEEEELV